MTLFEKGPGFKHGLKDFAHDVSFASASAALVGAILSFTLMISVYAMAEAGGVLVSDADKFLVGLILSCSILGIIVGFYYRKPMAICASMTGCAVWFMAAGQYSIAEAAAGSVASGILLLILAATGLMNKVVKLLPTSVVMGMVGGAFLSLSMNAVKPLGSEPVLGILALAVFFLCKKFLPKFPAVLAVLIIGVGYYIATGFAMPAFAPQFMAPRIILPAFTRNFPQVFLSLTIPLTALVLGAENAQAYGALRAENYDPSLNTMTAVSGVGGVLGGFFAQCNCNMAGPVTAICASPEAGKREGRWTASVLFGLIWTLVAPFYPSLVAFFTGFPSVFVYLVTGLAMLGVFQGAVKDAFADPKHCTSAVFALLTAGSGIKILGVGAPFWALVVGDLVYWGFENLSAGKAGKETD